MARVLTYTIEVLSQQAEERVRRVESAMQAAAKAAGTNGFAKAEKDLERAMKDAERAADKLNETIARQKDAMASADKQTSALMGSLNKIGGAIAAAFTVQKIIGFGESVLDAVGQIEDLHAATGVAREDLQRFGYVGAGIGVSMADIGRAAGTLSDRLVGGDDSISRAVSRLGLDIHQLIASGPTEAFLSIAESVGAIQDPMEKTNLAMDLFGDKLGRKLIPMLGDLREKMQDVPKDAIISDADIKAIDDAGDAIDQLTIKVKAWAATKFMSLVNSFKPSTEELLNMGVTFEGKGDIPLPAQVDIKTIKEQEEAAKKAAEAAKKAAEAYKQWADATKYVIESSKGHVAILDTINGATVEAIKYYREQGVAMSALGEMYGLTKVQIEAMTAAEKAEADAMRALAKEADDAARAFRNFHGSRKGDSTEVLDVPRALPPMPRVTSHPLGRSVMAGLGQTLRDDLPQAIMAAIQGGGSILRAAGSTIGSFLTSAGGFGSQISKGLTSVFGTAIGGALSSVLPGLGALVGPLIDKLVGKFKQMFGGPSQKELEGRAVESKFEKQFGSFDDMAKKIGDSYATVGRSRAEAEAAIKAMLAAEKQGADAVAAAIANLQGVLDHAAAIRQAAGQFGPSHTELVEAEQKAHEVYDYMVRMQQQGEYTQDQVNAAYMAWQEAMAAAGNEAAKAWVAAHKSAVEGSTAATSALDALRQKRDGLAQSIQNEAPEEVMGVIESQTRAQIDALNKQIEASTQTQTEAASDAADQTKVIYDGCWGRVGDGMIAHLDEAAGEGRDKILDTFSDFSIEIPVHWKPDALPGLSGEAPEIPIVPMASGGYGRVSGPTLFYSKGNEDFAFSGEGRSFSGSQSFTPPSSQQPVQHVYHINAVDAASFEQLAQRNKQAIADAALKGIKDGGKRLGVFRTMTRAVS